LFAITIWDYKIKTLEIKLKNAEHYKEEGFEVRGFVHSSYVCMMNGEIWADLISF
jgi:hypothetical protein